MYLTDPSHIYINDLNKSDPVHPSYHYYKEPGVRNRSMVLVKLEPLGLPATSWFAWMPWVKVQKNSPEGDPWESSRL